MKKLLSIALLASLSFSPVHLFSQTRKYYDAAAFGLKGHVKELVIEQKFDDGDEWHEIGRKNFDKDGRFKGHLISDNEEITRNNAGWIISVKCSEKTIDVMDGIISGFAGLRAEEFERQIEIYYKYDDSGFRKETEKRVYIDNQLRTTHRIHYVLDKDNILSLELSEKNGKNSLWSYSNYEFDDYGNWISRKGVTDVEFLTKEKIYYTERCIITYWNDIDSSNKRRK